ncbi:hypothetical protein [Bowmanella pacifica]|uniref:Uncharacterized protein n=1 Tax=Bowmanella pacifica TaxID=502051 RepID=A0A917Z0E7_9ALTE|nr:hypothetical protein [Bowmanella pacifica]GGO71542.1 hypothetical protein GCM10010982_27570 [Bowmanella pacifica]
MLASLFLFSSIASFSAETISGYWFGNDDEDNRQFLVYRSDNGEYISLQQFLEDDTVVKWSIQFGYWELLDQKIVVSHVGTYDKNGVKTTGSCELETSSYQVLEGNHDTLKYRSLDSNTVYVTYRTSPDKISGNDFVDYIEVIIKGINMHRTNCE